jgi:hypothetical protein
LRYASLRDIRFSDAGAIKRDPGIPGADVPRSVAAGVVRTS